MEFEDQYRSEITFYEINLLQISENTQCTIICTVTP